MLKNINAEYIKALINWAVDAWQNFPKKSDYVKDIIDTVSDSDMDNEESAVSESESKEFYMDSIVDNGSNNN